MFRPWVVPVVGLFCLAASPSESPEVRERVERVKTMFVGEPNCPADDRKACTKACTAAALKPYRYDTAGAAACERLGDIWSTALSMPDVGFKSYEDSCYMGHAPACEKEAAYHEAAGDKEKALLIRVAACEKGFEPACREAAATIERNGLSYDPVPYAVRWHVQACDQRVAESCTWLEAHPEAAAERRAAVADARAKDVMSVQTDQGTVTVRAITDVVPLLDTHKIVYTTHPKDQNPETGELIGKVCYEVWIPLAADKKVAMIATWIDSAARRSTLVQPELLSYSPFSPRTPASGCGDEIVQLAVN